MSVFDELREQAQLRAEHKEALLDFLRAQRSGISFPDLLRKGVILSMPYLDRLLDELEREGAIESKQVRYVKVKERVDA